MLTEMKLSYDGHSIFYRVIGNGRPVVLLHGFGEDGNVWKNQVELLSERFQLIVPDLPGSGQSEMIADMSMEGMAEVVRSIVDAELSKLIIGNERPAKVFMIGHSMGGYVSLAFAEKYRDYLSGFGLFHSTAYADSEEKKATRRKGIQFINQHGAFEFLKTSSYNLFSQISKNKTPRLIDEFIGGLHNFKPEALVSYYEAMINRPDRVNVLKNLSVPVLFIAGKYDNAVPLNDVLEQCHLPEISYFHVLAESGHMGMIEEAEKSNNILNDYLLNLSSFNPNLY